MGEICSGILYRSSHPIADGKQDPAIAELSANAHIAAILNLSDIDAEIKQKARLAPWYQKILNLGGV
ncbi:MAG: protein tyrosine phosphatase, partial [Spirochaetaceae bacterium]|nr:protein tyrosine phosphatase [Spirochaetaceae bacterium]